MAHRHTNWSNETLEKSSHKFCTRQVAAVVAGVNPVEAFKPSMAEFIVKITGYAFAQKLSASRVQKLIVGIKSIINSRDATPVRVNSVSRQTRI